jgi:hypothetical protein
MILLLIVISFPFIVNTIKLSGYEKEHQYCKIINNKQNPINYDISRSIMLLFPAINFAFSFECSSPPNLWRAKKKWCYGTKKLQSLRNLSIYCHGLLLIIDDSFIDLRGSCPWTRFNWPIIQTLRCTVCTFHYRSSVAYKAREQSFGVKYFHFNTSHMFYNSVHPINSLYFLWM